MRAPDESDLLPSLCACALPAQYDDSPEALAEALDALLEDPEFLDAVADEVRQGAGWRQEGGSWEGLNRGRPQRNDE